MIITKTPFRISIVGGGSDLEEFYSQSPGAVLSTTINKFMYLSSHRFYEEEIIVAKYSKTEMVKNLDDMKHPILKEVLKLFNVTGALEISSNADVAAGTGLGSSSAFTVGLLHNLHTVFGKFVTKKQLAEEACNIEINKLKEPIGKQDQYAVAFGGLHVFKFNSSGTVNVEPIHLSKDTYNTLQSNLVLFYLGNQRRSSQILAEQKDNLKLMKHISILKEMVSLVWELRDVLYKGNLDEFGKILHTNWTLKQQLASKISNTTMNTIYDTALKNGAIGGKLLGAGGGGFFLFYCNEDKQDVLRKSLSPLREMKFKFENEGSQLIYVGDEYLDD